MSTTPAESIAPDAVDDEAPLPAGLPEPQVVLRHAGLREREADEHADGVERDELGDLGAGDDDEDPGGAGQGDDAVGEHEAVAALGELAGQEAVAGLEAGQAGEVGEAGVGGQHQDEHRGGLQRVDEHLAERARCRRRPRRSGR